MATIGMTSNLLYAFFGGSIGDRLRASPRGCGASSGTGPARYTSGSVSPLRWSTRLSGDDQDERRSGLAIDRDQVHVDSRRSRYT